MVKMAQLIDAAVGKNPRGWSISIPDAAALGPAIQSAIDGGHPGHLRELRL